MELVPVQPGICGFDVFRRASFFWLFDRGGVVMYYAKHRVGCDGNFVLHSENILHLN